MIAYGAFNEYTHVMRNPCPYFGAFIAKALPNGYYLKVKLC